MSTFKVIEIPNATAIVVSPQWKLTLADGREMIDNKVRIAGLNTAPANEYVRLRLESFLRDKDVELLNPQVLNSNDPSTALISCTVLVDKTDITYYFPEFRSLPVIG
jgi:hypothetical protein